SLFLDSISISKYLSKEWVEIRSKERRAGNGKLANMVKEKQLFNEIKKEVEEKEEITVWKIIQHKYHLMGIGGIIIMSVNEDRLYNTWYYFPEKEETANLRDEVWKRISLEIGKEIEEIKGNRSRKR